MFHFDGQTDTEAETFDLLRTYLLNYRVNLIDAGNMENINRFHTDLQQIFGVLQYRGKELFLCQNWIPSTATSWN